MSTDQAAVLLHAARSALISHQLAVSGTDPQVVRLPEAATAELIRALSQTAGSVHQIVPFSGRTVELDRFSLLVWRDHAARGNDVRRLYLVPFGHPDADLGSLQVTDDAGSQIIAHRLYVGASAEAAEPMTSMWIVDDRAVVYEEHGDTGPPTWVVSVRREDLRAARDRWNRLWQRRSETVHEPPRVPEPLLESAVLCHLLAKSFCTGDHVDASGCSWYHGVWQYLRLFNMVSSPNWHARFYTDWLRQILRTRRRPRVLITGAADYGMLAYVLAAVPDRTALDVHVVDLCRTPLLANEWFAERLDVAVHTHQVDFLRAGDRIAEQFGPFDLIVSDALLTRFERDEAERVVANWRRALRPGGSAVTTVRLHDAELPGEDDTARAHTDFLLRLYERAKNSRWLLRIDFDELRHAADRYLQRMESVDLGDERDIVSLFTGQGFQVVKTEVGRVDGELSATNYLRIVSHT